MNNEPKQVIVIRKDLNMRKGKMIAQGSHASMKVILDMMTNGLDDFGSNWNYIKVLSLDINSPITKWLTGRFTKICVSVDSEQQLLNVYEKAKQSNIPCALITDAGLTEFNNVPTLTCCAIGPDYPEKIDPITKELKLL